MIEIETSDTDSTEPFKIDLDSKIIEFMVSIIWNIPSNEYMKSEWAAGIDEGKNGKPFLFTFDPERAQQTRLNCECLLNTATQSIQPMNIITERD